jgi:hypothetical protein
MKLERAGFWRRLTAAWIDWSLIYAVSSILIGAARLASIRVSLGQAGLAVAVVYGVVCLSRWGSTPGKALMGVWVQRKNGQAMNLRTALLREGLAKWGLTVLLPVWGVWRLARGVWIASIFDLLVIFLIMALALVYWLFAKATWYDHLSRTSVMRDAGQGALNIRKAFAAVAAMVLLCGGIKAAEYFRQGWISCNLALFNNGKSTRPYVTFLKRAHATPIDYVMALFDRYDVVVLCERAHPEFTQWEYIYDLVRDRRFLDRVGHVFTEYGLRNTQPVLDEFLNAPDLSEADIAARAIQVMRGISIWPYWNNTNFYEYLKKLYRLNQTLPREKRIQHYFTDVALDWDSIHSKRDFRSFLLDRDRKMSDVITGRMVEIAVSEPRKKCLVVMNYRHAFGPIKSRTGSLMDNTGRFLFEAIPGRVANVLLVNLVPIVPTYAVTIMAPVQGGAWDAAFEEAGNRPVGFDLAGTPFGEDGFDLYPFDPTMAARYRYQDVFTGYVIDRPLDGQFVERGIPGLYEGVEKIVLERSRRIDADTYALAGKMIANFSVTSRDRMYHQTSQTLVESLLLAVAGAGFLFAAIAFAVRRHRS